LGDEAGLLQSEYLF